MLIWCRPRAPLILNHITYLIVCKRLMCLQVVNDVQSDVQVRCQLCVIGGLFTTSHYFGSVRCQMCLDECI